MLDPLVGTGEFDFVKDLGKFMPIRVIGMLLGIPVEDQEAIRQHTDDGLRLEEGVPNETEYDGLRSASVFSDYITWRAEHPSDDLMTELLNAEFEDDHGTTRTLTHDEILGYVGLLSGAGNETTTRLIGFAGEVLGRHPDQRANWWRTGHWSTTPSRSCCATKRPRRFSPVTWRGTSRSTGSRCPGAASWCC